MLRLDAALVRLWLDTWGREVQVCSFQCSDWFDEACCLLCGLRVRGVVIFRVVLPPRASSRPSHRAVSSPSTPRERVVIDSGMMNFAASDTHFEKFW